MIPAIENKWIIILLSLQFICSSTGKVILSRLKNDQKEPPPVL
jgi:hypothetical protein